jgi:hypothetical protein
VSWDYRHWYYQLKLPIFVRSLFTFLSRLTAIELKVWAMGFSWTPYAGQATVIGGLISKRLGLDSVEDITEARRIPVVITWKKGGRVVSFSLAWADNVLVASDEHTARQWALAVEKECGTLARHVTIKDPGILISKGKVQFIGVDWETTAIGHVTARRTLHAEIWHAFVGPLLEC